MRLKDLIKFPERCGTARIAPAWIRYPEPQLSDATEKSSLAPIPRPDVTPLAHGLDDFPLAHEFRGEAHQVALADFHRRAAFRCDGGAAFEDDLGLGGFPDRVMTFL